MEGIFNRMGTGGTGGGNSNAIENLGVTRVELFSASDNLSTEAARTTFELSDDYDNYDYLEFSVWRRYQGLAGSYNIIDDLNFIYPINQLNEIYNSGSPEKCLIIHFWQSPEEWKRLKFNGKNKIIIPSNSAYSSNYSRNLGISKIYGIKLNTVIDNSNNSNSSNSNNNSNNNNSATKTFTWVGTGATTNTITFPNKPIVIVGIWGEGTSATDSISWQSQMFGIGQIYPYNYVSGSQKGTGQSNVSWNSINNSMTLSHAEAAGCANKNGVTYTCLYII